MHNRAVNNQNKQVHLNKVSLHSAVPIVCFQATVFTEPMRTAVKSGFFLAVNTVSALIVLLLWGRGWGGACSKINT